MCKAAKHFKAAGSTKRHILLVHLNENWGAFSGHIPNRTVDWGTMHGTLGDCTLEEVMEYINHNNTLGVFTAQFQQLDHPKVHSVPLGMTPNLRALPYWKFRNRTQLLMMNANAPPSSTRRQPFESVIQNFNGTIQNTYGGETEDYVSEILRSKFVLAPSGLGWDCYRNWEALAYGTILVIEHYNRSDGMYRNFEGLPVVWVTTFDEVTPALLESEYTRLSRLRNYTWEKLTNEYWIAFANSLRKSSQMR
jgi:hypothetical protein